MSLVNLSSLLKRSSLFANFDEYTLNRLAETAIKLEVGRANTLTQRYSPNKYAFFIITGLVGTVTYDDEGKRFVVQAYAPDELVDVSDLFADRSNQQEVMSLVRSTVLCLSKTQLKEAMASKRTILMDFSMAAVKQSRQQQDGYISFGMLTVTNRIKNYLIDHSVTSDGNRVFVKRIGYSLMGQILGCSREMVQNVVRKLKEKAYLVETDEAIFLSDGLTKELDVNDMFNR